MTPSFVGRPVWPLVFLFTLGAWVVIEIRQAMRRRPEATNVDRGSRIVVQASASAGVIIAALAHRVTATEFEANTYSFGISLMLLWAGIALRWWCFRTLGRYFTFTVMTSADQPVITNGPYRVLRHPSYTALLLILAGIGLSYGNWSSLAALTVLPLIGVINRIRVEEAGLSAALGAAYTRYASTRKRIVPFVW